MGGYISTYLNTTPVQPVKDASGTTVPVTDASSIDVFPIPPAYEPQQTTIETVQETVQETAPPISSAIEQPSPSIEKVVEVEALPNLHKTQINGKNKKKGRKH